VESSLFAVLGLGFLLGLKHAAEADHVMAVTTFLSQERSLLRSCWVGLFWGAGHTLSLALAGTLIVPLKLNVSERLTGWLELAVAGMLVVLGAQALYRTWKDKFRLHRHPHMHAAGRAPHEHWHLHVKGKLQHNGWLHVGLRPLLVGVVHGAAGTGALMLLVFSTIHSPLRALLYILIFGAGSIAGMLIVSFVLAVPFQWAARRVASSYRIVQVSAGVFSCAFGIYLGVDIWERLL
jgi:ABC-type nickel/cobalt efflux system permease component RcnA